MLVRPKAVSKHGYMAHMYRVLEEIKITEFDFLRCLCSTFVHSLGMGVFIWPFAEASYCPIMSAY